METKEITPKGFWEKHAARKSSMLSRCESYSKVTLPYVFPDTSTGDKELQSASDSTGARAVNFLTNKLVMTLFPENQPFFRLQVASDIVKNIADAAHAGDMGAKQVLDSIDADLANAEKKAVQLLGYTKFRTEATAAMRLLIITGNAMMYHPKDGNPQVYSLRDYCVERDVSGTVIAFVTRDTKSLGTFSQEVQDKVNADKKRKLKPHDQVTLYTMVKLVNSKYELTQSIEDIKLDSEGTYVADELPWKILTWNLLRGEDYGHGLVEDHYGDLHSLAILSEALVSGAAVAAQIKFLVAPTSVLDVAALNASESGSFHSGNEGDITCVQVNKALDFNLVMQSVDRLERSIAAVFLMNSAVQRDAERVTAEEIRYVAQELETSHAGVYSRLAMEWQLPTAIMLLARAGTKIGPNSDIQPQIITGIDALSRAGELDNWRAFMSDLSALNSVPEDVRRGFNIPQLFQFLGIRRGVDYAKFSKTPAELQQEMAQEAQMQQDLQNNEAKNQLALEAGKSTMGR